MTYTCWASWASLVAVVVVSAQSHVCLPTDKHLDSCQFVIYDEEFRSILGENPELITLARENNAQYFHEGGVFLPDTNEVVFSSNRYGNLSCPDQHINMTSISLDTGDVAEMSPQVDVMMANGMSIPPSGGSTHVLVCDQGGNETASSLKLVDVQTFQTTTLVDRFQGKKTQLSQRRARAGFGWVHLLLRSDLWFRAGVPRTARAAQQRVPLPPCLGLNSAGGF
mmetsp:Transcript_33604/g.66106  ORF Transcript_33604/g.66106 Transcript_33604/m.66106 type:complete len:224 (+) Transcript_33604:12-683(+)